MSLKDKKCIELPKGSPSLDDAQVTELLAETPSWTASAGAPGQARHLSKTYQFDDFVGAMAFVNRMAALAESEQHHPDFSVHYSKVDVTSSTHSVGGLSENDFILAAKLDAVFGLREPRR